MQKVPSGLWLMAALAWLCLALGCFYLAAQNEQFQNGNWLGFFALALVLYNLLRWWTYRRRPNQQPQSRPTPPRRVFPREENGKDLEGRDRFPPITD